MKFMSLRRTIAAVLSISLASVVHADVKTIDVPAGDLVVALESLAKQAGVEFFYQTQQVQGLRTQGVHGNLSPEEAVSKLLEGTSLILSTDEASGVLLITEERATQLSNRREMNLETNWRLAQASTQTYQSDGLEAEEVIVTAAPYRFLDADTSGTTNLPLPIEKVPQSITLLSADFIQATSVKKVADLIRYTAGASSVGTNGLVSTQRLRGFDTGGMYSRYADGLSIANSIEVEFSFLDRVELVKGPSSVTYGISSPGGLYNFVSKKPPKIRSGRVAAEVGSWDSYRAEAELGGPLNDSGSLRGVAVAVHDEGNSFIRHSSHEESGIYGALEYSDGGRLSGGVNVKFGERSGPISDGFLYHADGRRPNVSRSFFFGDPERSRTGNDYAVLAGHLDFAVTDDLELSLKANYQDISYDFFFIYGFGLSDAGEYGLGGSVWDRGAETFATSLNALYRFNLWGVEGSFLSVSATHMRLDSYSVGQSFQSDGSFSTSANLSQGEAGLRSAISSFAPVDPIYSSVFETDSKLFSAQTLLKITPRLALLAGASISDPNQSSSTSTNDNSYNARSSFSFDRGTSLRGGVTYEIAESSSAYLSYSDSFEPQALNDINGNILAPTEGRQWEAGIKSRQIGGKLLLTAAAFQIEQKNSAAFGGIGPGGVDYYYALGAVEHRGVELEAMGLLTRSLTVSAAASYLDAKITADSNELMVGRERLFRPQQSASVFAVKNFEGGMLRGFNVGGGLRYVGEMKTSYDGSSRDLPSYAVMDLIAGYKAERWSAQLKLNNVFDKFYVEGNNYDSFSYGNTLGQPFNVRLRFTRDFGG